MWSQKHVFSFHVSHSNFREKKASPQKPNVCSSPVQFLSMGPAQREAVWHALKDDAEKLLAESSGSPDRDSRRLKDELAECQRIFSRLSDEAAARGAIVIGVYLYLSLVCSPFCPDVTFRVDCWVDWVLKIKCLTDLFDLI